MRLSTPARPTAWAPSSVPSGGEARDEMHLFRPRVVARVVPGVDVDHLVLDPRLAQGGLVRAGGRGGQAEDPHDRSAQNSGLGGRAVPADGVRRPTTLSVGRAGKRNGNPCSGDGLGDLNGVADRPDVRVGGLLVGVDADRTGRAQVQTNLASQRARGPYADVDDDEVGGQGGPIGEGDRDGAGRAVAARGLIRAQGGDRLRGHGQAEVDAVRCELLGQQGCELGVQWRQDVVGQLDQMNFQAARGERLDRLEADETGTDDDSARGLPARASPFQQIFDAIAQPVDVGHGAQGVHARVVQALDGWGHGHRTGRQQQCVVGEEVGAIGRLDGDLLGRAVDAGDPVSGAHVQVQGCRK